MQTQALDIRGSRAIPANPAKRILSLSAAGLLHAVIFYGLFQAFIVPQISKPPKIFDVVPVNPEPPPTPTINVEKPVLIDPQVITATEPDVKVQADTNQGVAPVLTDKPVKTAMISPKIAATDALSITATHTIPPYPAMAIRLGQQGTVTLRIAVAEDGSVRDATVEQSSGSDTLDAAAIDWVKAKWRYKAATRDGEAVTSTVLAAVRFDLKKAR